MERSRVLFTVMVTAASFAAGPIRADGDADADAAPQAPDAVAGVDAEGFTLVTDPARIVLGDAEQVVFHLAVRDPDGEDRPLRGSVNVGELGEIVRVGRGRYRADYTPPAARFPQVAIVALWRESGPDAPVAFFRVPLRGTARVPFRTRAGATVNVDVDGERFGPFEVGRDGRGEARLVVPPGVVQATLEAESADGETTTSRLDLDVPPYNRLTLAVVPHAVTADGVSPVRVHLYYDVHGRRAPPAERMRIEVPVGSVTAPAHRGGTLYEATYTAPPGTPDRQVELRAAVVNDGASTARASLSVGRQRPARADVFLSHEAVVADGEAVVEVRVAVRDALGLGIAGLTVRPAVEPAEAVATVAEVEDEGGGHYRFAVTPVRRDPDGGAARIAVRVTTEDVTGEAAIEADAWRPHRIATSRERFALAADGRSTAILDVQAFDADGRPMDHLEPRVRATSGRVQPPVALEDGGWRLRYTAPTWRYDAFRRRGGAPTREESLQVTVGGVTSETPVLLTAQAEAARLPRVYAEAGGGWRAGLGVLAGPAARARAGVHLLHRPALTLSAGIAAEISDQRGGWALEGGVDGWARVRVMSVPILATFDAELPVAGWRLGIGAGAGVLLAPGHVRLPGTGDVSVGATMPAGAGRLYLGRRLGPGFVVVEGSYLYAERGRHRGGVDVVGAFGGAGGSVGYRVER